MGFRNENNKLSNKIESFETKFVNVAFSYKLMTNHPLLDKNIQKMKPPKAFIIADYYIQTILGILFLLTVWIFWGVLILIPFGAWQVLSALIWILGFGDRSRLKYLAATGAYGALCVLTELLGWPEILAYLLIAPPPVLGVWYYIITRRDYNEGSDTAPDDFDNILDTKKVFSTVHF